MNTMDTKQFYIVVSGDEYGGYWLGKRSKRWSLELLETPPPPSSGMNNITCANCGNKHFIPVLFVEKHAAEEYVERYLNSYVDCFNENIEDKSDGCWCKLEIQICEIQAPCDDKECLYVTVSSAPYGGAFKNVCYECNATEFMMKLFIDKHEAEKYVDDFRQNIAPPCKSCMYNYEMDIIELHLKS
jgi:hypothetical protein